MANEVYAKTLPDGISDVAVKRYFSRFGDVLNVTVCKSKDGNRTFGFIKFDNLESCQRCADASPIMIDEKRVYVAVSNKVQREGSDEQKSSHTRLNGNADNLTRDTRHAKQPDDNPSRPNNGFANHREAAENGPIAGLSMDPAVRQIPTDVCVTFTDRFSGMVFVQNRDERKRMLELSDRIALIAGHNRSGLTGVREEDATKGLNVAIQVRKFYFRGSIVDQSSDNSGYKIYFLDTGKTGITKSHYIFRLPEGIELPNQNLCSKVYLDGVDRQAAIDAFKNVKSSAELFGSSINIFATDEPVKWFNVLVTSSDGGSLTIKLINDGKCLNDTLSNNKQSVVERKWSESSDRMPSSTTGSLENDVSNQLTPGKEIGQSSQKPEKRFTKFVADMVKRQLGRDSSYVLTYASSFNRVCLCPDDVMAQAIEICDNYANCVKSRDPDGIEKLQIGELVMALYDADQAWYRGQVLSQSGDIVEILFIDFGNVERVKTSACRLLRAEDKAIIELPYALIQCRLKGNWAGKSIEQFTEMALNKAYKCQFKCDAPDRIEIVSAIDNSKCDLLDLLDQLQSGVDSMLDVWNDNNSTVVENDSNSVASRNDLIGNNKSSKDIHSQPAKPKNDTIDRLASTPKKLSKLGTSSDVKLPGVTGTQFFARDMSKQGVIQGGEYTLTYITSFDNVYMSPSDVMLSAMKACEQFGNSIKSVDSNAETSYPMVNQIVMAKYEADDAWYRGQVIYVDKQSESVDILFIDFGNVERVHRTACRALSKEDAYIFDIPCGLMECALCGNWAGKSIEQFTEMALNKAYKCQFKCNAPDRIEIVSAIDSGGIDILDLSAQLKPGLDYVEKLHSVTPKSNEHYIPKKHLVKATASKTSNCHPLQAEDGVAKGQSCPVEAEGLSKAIALLKVRVNSGRQFIQQLQEQIRAEEEVIRQLEKSLTWPNKNGDI